MTWSRPRPPGGSATARPAAGDTVGRISTFHEQTSPRRGCVDACPAADRQLNGGAHTTEAEVGAPSGDLRAVCRTSGFSRATCRPKGALTGALRRFVVSVPSPSREAGGAPLPGLAAGRVAPKRRPARSTVSCWTTSRRRPAPCARPWRPPGRSRSLFRCVRRAIESPRPCTAADRAPFGTVDVVMLLEAESSVAAKGDIAMGVHGAGRSGNLMDSCGTRECGSTGIPC